MKATSQFLGIFFVLAGCLPFHTLAQTCAVIDAAGEIGQYSSLSLDQHNRPCVSYYDASNKQIKYASFDGTNWQKTIVQAGGASGVGKFTSLSIDPSGRHSITCYDADRAALTYAGWLVPFWSQTTEVVHAGTDVGKYSSLTRNHSGNLCVSYYDPHNAALQYACLTGSTWQIQTVDSPAVGQYSALAIDEHGRGNIAYYDAARGSLKYAGWTTSFWENAFETVETGGGDDLVGHYSSLVLDPTGRLCVAYSNYHTNRYLLRVATKQGSAWQHETVDASGNVGAYASFAVDTNARNNVVYYDGERGALKCAGWLPSFWTTMVEVVDAGPPDAIVGRYSSLVLNDHQQLCVAYSHYQTNTYATRFACHDAGHWDLHDIDTDGNVGNYTSLAIDSNGQHDLVYHDATRGALKYAGWISPFWSIDRETVETTTGLEDVGQYSSLALNEDGRLSVAYYDAFNRVPRFASHNGSAWNLQTIDQGGDLGQFCSLSIDQAGRKNIVYYDNATVGRGALKYAGWTSDFWALSVDTVESTVGLQDVGRYSSLALNQYSYPSVSYYDTFNVRLRYAAFDGQSWQKTVVDNTGNPGQYSSLAIDALGNIYLSYYGATDGILKYASHEEALAPMGTPEWWLALHQLTNDPPATEELKDTDLDLMDAWREFVADTDPNDASSYLGLIGLCPSNGGVWVEWKGGQKAKQYLECCPDLTSTTEQWVAIYTNNPITPLTNSVLDAGATNRTLFYRIRAQR